MEVGVTLVGLISVDSGREGILLMTQETKESKWLNWSYEIARAFRKPFVASESLWSEVESRKKCVVANIMRSRAKRSVEPDFAPNAEPVETAWQADSDPTYRFGDRPVFFMSRLF